MSSDGREQAGFQMNIPSGKASELQASGRDSQEKRGKGRPDSFKIPNAGKKTQLQQSAKASQENRGQHTTGQIADEYTANSESNNEN
jgi:hypothetical protein